MRNQGFSSIPQVRGMNKSSEVSEALNKATRVTLGSGVRFENEARSRKCLATPDWLCVTRGWCNLKPAWWGFKRNRKVHGAIPRVASRARLEPQQPPVHPG